MRYPVISIIVLLLSACGGGNGGGGTTATAPPAPLTLTSTTPANNATGDISAPTITFDAAPDKATVTASSISLSSPIGPVDSTPTVTGNTVTVTPSHSLVWGSHYQLTISDAVHSSAGGKLSAAATIGFDTRMPVWGSATAIPSTSASNASTYLLKTVSAPNGDAVAAWLQLDNISADSGTLMAARYTAATQSWSAPATLPGNSKLVITPGVRFDLDVNAAGNAAAAWAEDQGNGTLIIKASRYTASGGWSAPVSLSNADNMGSGGLPQIAVSQNGNIIATWIKNTGPDSTIYAAYYDASSQQWSATRSLGNPIYADFIRAGIGANGTAMVFWSESTQDGTGLRAVRYDGVNKNWGATTVITTDTDGNESTLNDIAFDAAGNAIAILGNSAIAGNGPVSVGIARNDAVTGAWSKIEYISTSAAIINGIDIDAAGNALLVWIGGAPGAYTLESSRYQPTNNSWTALPSQKISLDSILVSPAAPHLDAAGNGWITWSGKNGSNYNINAMRYNATASKWEVPQIVATDSGFMDHPSLSMDQTGQAMLVWEQHSGDFFSDAQIAYNRLTAH